jgi:hypothetical protein
MTLYFSVPSHTNDNANILTDRACSNEFSNIERYLFPILFRIAFSYGIWRRLKGSGPTCGFKTNKKKCTPVLEGKCAVALQLISTTLSYSKNARSASLVVDKRC